MFFVFFVFYEYKWCILNLNFIPFSKKKEEKSSSDRSHTVKAIGTIDRGGNWLCQWVLTQGPDVYYVGLIQKELLEWNNFISFSSKIENRKKKKKKKSGIMRICLDTALPKFGTWDTNDKVAELLSGKLGYT